MVHCFENRPFSSFVVLMAISMADSCEACHREGGERESRRRGDLGGRSNPVGENRESGHSCRSAACCALSCGQGNPVRFRVGQSAPEVGWTHHQGRPCQPSPIPWADPPWSPFGKGGMSKDAEGLRPSARPIFCHSRGGGNPVQGWAVPTTGRLGISDSEPRV
jgi:hypothetical protein